MAFLVSHRPLSRRSLMRRKLLPLSHPSLPIILTRRSRDSNVALELYSRKKLQKWDLIKAILLSFNQNKKMKMKGPVLKKVHRTDFVPGVHKAVPASQVALQLGSLRTKLFYLDSKRNLFITFCYYGGNNPTLTIE